MQHGLDGGRDPRKLTWEGLKLTAMMWAPIVCLVALLIGLLVIIL